MSSGWNPKGPVTAWTLHDGPNVEVREPDRRWSYGLAGGWIAVMAPIFALGCPCVEDGTCIEPPAVSVAGGIAFVLMVPAVVGLFMRRRWGAWFSVPAAVAAFVPAGWEIGHAPLLGVFQFTGFALLLAGGLVLGRALHRYTVASRNAFATAAAPLPNPPLSNPPQPSTPVPSDAAGPTGDAAPEDEDVPSPHPTRL